MERNARVKRKRKEIRFVCEGILTDSGGQAEVEGPSRILACRIVGIIIVKLWMRRNGSVVV